MKLIKHLWGDGIDRPVPKLLMNMGEALVWLAPVFFLGLIIGAETHSSGNGGW